MRTKNINRRSVQRLSALLLFALVLPIILPCSLATAQLDNRSTAYAQQNDQPQQEPLAPADAYIPPRKKYERPSSKADRLFSPSISQKFYELAYELAGPDSDDPQITDAQNDQAIIFLTAAVDLDSRAKHTLPELIKLASRYSPQDRSELLLDLLDNYVDKFADLEVTRKAVGYLLEQQDSREQREQLLGYLLNRLGQKNDGLSSELSTSLGLLMAEKADVNNAAFLLMSAYSSNKYNKLAFSKLTEIIPEQIEPAMYLEHLRLTLGQNPFDLETAVAFAMYADSLQLYQLSADAYEYCANLFNYLYRSQPLPAYIYLPWSLSCYNTQRSQHKCLQIASDLRQNGQFDLIAEAIAAKAAAKIGNSDQATDIFFNAENKALQILYDDTQLASTKENVDNQKMAWFYCFALPNPQAALDWANKAYAAEPNSPMAASLLAYSLVLNNQNEFADSIVKDLADSPIADLARARIQMDKGQKDDAIKTLKDVIAFEPGAIEAELAKELLIQNGTEYIPPMDTAIILTTLSNTFGQNLLPDFSRPGNIISAQLNLQGSKFSYGSDFGASVAITNNSSEPMVIGDDSLFKGHIRIDAAITGDLEKNIPNLVSTRIRPGLPVEPGRSILAPLRLATGELRSILQSHPQASLDLEFTVYLDPVTTIDGKVSNRLSIVKPVKVLVSRSSVDLTAKYLQNRLNAMSKSTGNSRNQKTAELFIGLLIEQHAMANREPLYKFMYANWMPPMLKSALVYSLKNDGWVTKAHTMASMQSLPMDYELVNAVSSSFNDTHWPVRMMAIYLLATTQEDDFAKVLDWSAKYDTNEFVRQMAIALGAVVPEPPQEPKNPNEGEIPQTPEQ